MEQYFGFENKSLLRFWASRTGRQSRMVLFSQFDLLAKLGGLRLNLGGEVRGYFPNNSPTFTAYIGTAFSIQKLADFVSK
ncbi:MAG: hypothetical protein WDO71_17855 [Bacteroidota bacterium]